ncbi:hypothetical protein GCM10009673_17590 [Nesterenkonia sandarakina]
MTKPTQGKDTAVFFFVAATFVLIFPVVLLPDSPIWLRILSLIVGITLMVLGFPRLAAERARKNSARNQPPTTQDQ